jgi:hypothetical protein
VSDKQIKVTDKRIFTTEGDLKEEYRFLEENATAAASATATPPAPSPPPGRAPEPPPLEIPGSPPGLGAPTFFDLAAMLAEQAALYLGDLATDEGPIPENLELARLHIDLLDVLRQKTAGNLTAQEAAFLEDLLYRLRVRYVQKRG